MTRSIHDQFAKKCLTELLAPLGEVKSGFKITAEVREADLLFLRNPNATKNVPEIGLLGKLAATSALFEPFRNPVNPKQIRSCLGKLFDTHAKLEREAKGEKKTIAEPDVIRLWILSPTVSTELLGSCGATAGGKNWREGVYFLPKVLKTGIIAIDQLPRTPETLWLRILGRGKVQQQAIRELKSLQGEGALHNNVLELVYEMLAILEAREKQNLDVEAQELIMELSTIYLERLKNATEEGIQRGIQRGIQQGKQESKARERRASIESLLRIRFGTIDEPLSRIIEPIIALSPEEFTPLLLQLSREELLARFLTTDKTIVTEKNC